MTAYGSYLDSVATVHARWRFRDASVADGATCADLKGTQDALYEHNAGSIAATTSPIIGDTQALDMTGSRVIRSGVPVAAAPASIQTILIWVRFDSATGFDYIYHAASASNNYIAAFKSGAKIDCRAIIGGVGHSVQSDSFIVADTWYQIGIHINGSGDRKLTVNGVDHTVAHSSAIGYDGAAIALGARIGGQAPLRGHLADVAITSHLTVAQALAAYQLATTPADDIVPRYEVYRRDTIIGADTRVGIMPADELTFTIGGLAADSVGWYWVNPVTACGVGNTQGVARRLRQAALDGSADLIPPSPNAPYGLALTPGAGGQVTATWRYRADGAEADAAKFFVYVAEGAAAFDFNTPTHTVEAVRVTNTQDLGAFADGTTVRCVVRAATSADVAETNTTEATAVADATAPAAPVTIVTEVVGA